MSDRPLAPQGAGLDLRTAHLVDHAQLLTLEFDDVVSDSFLVQNGL